MHVRAARALRSIVPCSAYRGPFGSVPVSERPCPPVIPYAPLPLEPLHATLSKICLVLFGKKLIKQKRSQKV